MGAGRLTPSISKSLTGIAATGGAGTVTASATAPSAPSEDVWEKVSNDYAISDSRSGPAEPFHHDAEYIDSTDEVFISWRTPSSSPSTRNGTFMFDCVTGDWRQTNSFAGGVDGDGNYRALGQRENFSMCYDNDRDCLWMSSGSPSGTIAGSTKYDVQTDIFTEIATANFIIVNGRVGMAYYDGYVYSWRGEGFKRYNIGTGGSSALTTPTGMTLHLSSGSANTDLRLNIQARSGFNRTGLYLWVIDVNADIWTADVTQTSPSFTLNVTTGDKPIVAEYGCPAGVVCCVDESRNVLVAWIAGAADNGAGLTGTNRINKTWVLDLSTWVWRFGPQYSAGDTVPLGQDGANSRSAASLRMVYDRLRQRCLLTVPDDFKTAVWSFKPRFKSQWDAFALPTASGSTYGVNYVGFPFVTNAGSKNINIAYSPTTNRLYATGGDCGSSPGSASDTPGVWSMSMADGTWRLDSGYDTDSNWPYPQPNGYQDNSLFQWMPNRGKFLFGFNPGESYNDPGDNLWQYAQGVWFYDPSLYPDPDAWTQDLTLAPSGWETTNTQGPDSGCAYGGWWDETTDIVYAFNQVGASSAMTVRRYDIAAMSQLSNLSFSVTNISGHAKYFNTSGPVGVGRYIYAIGSYYDGASSRIIKLLRWDIDANTGTMFDGPTLSISYPDANEIKLETSNGKIVWPVRTGPTGVIHHIFVWDPDSQTWSDDTSRPSYGSFYCNASCSLPDGRIVMTGGGFGSLPTHVWFYTAP